MGREWYWGGGGGGRSSSKRGGSSSRLAETDHISSGGGCMCAIFQAFDFHPLHFSINHQPTPPSSISQDLIHTSIPKGAEAPRNSLESEEGTASCISKEEDLKIPRNIRIRTRGTSTKSRAGNLSDVSSEISISSSPGTKTPTLVARLMGLDILPDAHSSSSSSSSCLSTPNQQLGNNHPHLHHLKQRKQHIQILRHRNSTDNIGTIRSLPETPRMSLARRSDVEHRLSLQINKENMGICEELDPPRFSFSKRKYDENNNSCRSPSHYARQIVKQVKESVSRRVGLDITNTVKNREQAREELVGQFRFKKLTKKSSSVDESSPGKNSNSSYSPRLSRFLETKHKPSAKQTSPSPLTPKDQNTKQVALKPPSPPPPVTNIIETTQLSSRVLTKPKPQQALPEKELLQSQKRVPKCKKVTNDKFSSRLNKPPPQTSIKNKQEESFVTRPPSPTRSNDIKAKSKRTHPLSSNLLNSLNNVSNVLPFKKDPSLPATKIPQKQVCDTQEPKIIAQLSSCSRQKYKQEPTHTLATRGTNSEENKSNSASTTTTEPNDEGAEFQYITTILTQTGLRKATLPNLQFQWFSLSHPLDPSVFHNLENNPSSNSSLSCPRIDKDYIFKQKDQLGLRCNRRLLFDLVDELLSEILVRPKSHKGLLLETVWKRVRSFPRAKCEFLEDIDGLIEMEDTKGKMKAAAEEEEGEGVVVEIGRSILETLVHETVTVMVGA